MGWILFVGTGFFRVVLLLHTDQFGLRSRHEHRTVTMFGHIASQHLFLLAERERGRKLISLRDGGHLRLLLRRRAPAARHNTIGAVTFEGIRSHQRD